MKPAIAAAVVEACTESDTLRGCPQAPVATLLGVGLGCGQCLLPQCCEVGGGHFLLLLRAFFFSGHITRTIAIARPQVSPCSVWPWVAFTFASNSARVP